MSREFERRGKALFAMFAKPAGELANVPVEPPSTPRVRPNSLALMPQAHEYHLPAEPYSAWVDRKVRTHTGSGTRGVHFNKSLLSLIGLAEGDGVVCEQRPDAVVLTKAGSPIGLRVVRCDNSIINFYLGAGGLSFNLPETVRIIHHQNGLIVTPVDSLYARHCTEEPATTAGKSRVARQRSSSRNMTGEGIRAWRDFEVSDGIVPVNGALWLAAGLDIGAKLKAYCQEHVVYIRRRFDDEAGFLLGTKNNKGPSRTFQAANLNIGTWPIVRVVALPQTLIFVTPDSGLGKRCERELSATAPMYRKNKGK